MPQESILAPILVSQLTGLNWLVGRRPTASLQTDGLCTVGLHAFLRVDHTMSER